MNETLILSLHALPGLIALILGSVVLLSKKGTKTHKRRGYVWLGLMVLISLIFLKNQTRPITNLAKAAEKFGKGEEIEEFKPSGAA